MPPAILSPGQCIICAFRKTQWGVPHALGSAVIGTRAKSPSTQISGRRPASTESLASTPLEPSFRISRVRQRNPSSEKLSRRDIFQAAHLGESNLQLPTATKQQAKGTIPIRKTLGRFSVGESTPELPETKYGKKRGIPIRKGLGFLSVSGSDGRNDFLSFTVLSQVIGEQLALYTHRLRVGGPQSLELVGLGIKSIEDLNFWEARFNKKIIRESNIAVKGPSPETALFNKLRQTFVTRDIRGLRAAVQYAFSNFVLNSGFTGEDVQQQTKLADLRYPLEWFPATRGVQRKVHLHVGPTNSGKTYQALKRLEAANSGVYAGPLRLLAHEVYQRLNSKGKKCSLVTGEEKRIPEKQEHFMSSCTVEMVPLNVDVDVAVIDEIQMIGDSDRGWAWTQAFLGLKAKELHLCGELRTIPLIKDLCAQMGDSLEIHRYQRLSPLATMDHSLKGDLTKLERGDCVIVFSRLGIHAMKTDIERETGMRCAVVYGSLPPETRAQQAALFNDPDNEYDILVASDAVGMGLNLSIKRIIFEATSKHNGTSFAVIDTSDLKQIAGRAGRFRTAAQDIKAGPTFEGVSKDASKESQKATDNRKIPSSTPKSIQTTGLVTSLEDFDLPFVQKAMALDAPPIKTAGIYPPTTVLAKFAAYFPATTPFSYILMRLHEISTIHHRFHLCQFNDQIELADMIQPYNFTIAERIAFIAAPVSLRDEGIGPVVKRFARAIADQTGGDLLEMEELELELLDEDGEGKGYLKKIEALHKAITLYLWLSYRFAGAFKSQKLAFHIKGLVEERIDRCLAGMAIHSSHKKWLTLLRQRAMADRMAELNKPTVSDDLTSAIPGVDDQDDSKAAPPLHWEDGDGEDPLLDIPDSKAEQAIEAA